MLRCMGRRLGTVGVWIAPSLAAVWADAGAQTPRDSLGVLRVTVRSDSLPVRDAFVRSGAQAVRTSSDGAAVLTLAVGMREVIVRKIGFRPETLTVSISSGATVTRDVTLAAVATDLDAVVITSTRTERRVEDEPTRVEVLARDEIEEKLLMTPGDIAMMLNETSGLRVQTTSPSLGGVSVRIQGLRGRYTQLLSDGLPLYGGQAGGLGLLQVPPMDLGQVEVIKGAATALYGSAALGGVINLLSRRPGDEHEREILLNQTTRDGTDGLLWLSGPARSGWGYTLLAGAHRQSQTDLDDDGWTDLAGYERGVLRPRMFWNSEQGHSLFVTAGYTTEDREGGTLSGRVAPDGAPFAEALETKRTDAGVVGRFLLGRSILSVRASAMQQQHSHLFGVVAENDRHRTGFGEVALARSLEGATLVVGVALQGDDYRADELPAFNYSFTTQSGFAQAEVDPAEWISMSASARVDAHSGYGTFVNPRIAVLLRVPNEWTARVSIGTGAFAPTPFTEESEVIGLTQIQPLRDVSAERATTYSFDAGGPAGPFELNATLFGSHVRRPLALVAVDTDPGLRLVNAAEPTRTTGGEVFARWKAEAVSVTMSYAHVRSRELDLATGTRRDVPLTPRNTAGIVGMWEEEDRGRVGFEFYYTGRQALDDNPYRAESRPYVIVGALVEWHVGWARLFLNAENLGDVRQTRFDPLVRPAAGRGGRWTTDAWTELSGRTLNGGVRISF